jgi:hypothetical protein
MNAKGPDWCEENIEEIIDFLKAQAESRKLGHLFFRPAVRLLVRQAIKRARKKIANGECS